MNFLKNPIVVGALAVLAAALVFQRVVWPLVKPTGARRQAPIAASAASPTGVDEPGPAVKTIGASMPLSAVDVSAVERSEGPQRDPFQKGLAANTRSGANSAAAQLLQLKAVWRQTGSTLAVINGQVVKEGEDILGYTVQSIEDTRVWVTGPNGREAVEFKGLSEPPVEVTKVERDPSPAPTGKPNQ